MWLTFWEFIIQVQNHGLYITLKGLGVGGGCRGTSSNYTGVSNLTGIILFK